MAADAAPVADVQPKAKIFISYSRKDIDFANRLEAALKARGFEPLIDRTEIYAFEDWWKRIEGLIGRADSVVFVLSPDAVASEVALREVAHAASLNKRFAPIVCRRTDDSAVPEALRRLNFVFFDDSARFEASADQLADALNTDIGWVRHHTEYGEAARRWAEGDRKSGLLLRSPILEEAERWIASRPRGAPEPTAETQAFVTDSRRGATRRRNVLTGSLGAGLVVALVLAGLAFWQRQVAVQERQIADQQRKRAEDTLAAATQTANSLVSDLAQRFNDAVGIPQSLIKDILERARGLQDQLIKSGQVTPALQRSEAEALIESVDTLIAVGDAPGALTAGQEAQKIFAALLAGSPSSTDYQHELSTADANLGNAQVALGDQAGALTSYRGSLAILKQLTNSNPGNAAWQGELAYEYIQIGDVLTRQGDLASALKSFNDGLGVAQRSAQSNAGNTELQLDVSMADQRIGYVQVAQGDLAGALASYRASLDIGQKLAQSNSSGSFQRDLSIAYNKVGSVQEAQGDLAGALTSYQAGLAVIGKLAQTDAGNADWQDDLALANENVGGVQAAQKNLAGALTSDQNALTILKRLGQSFPANNEWQGHLAAAYGIVGNVQRAQGDLISALSSYRNSAAIFERLTISDPSDYTVQHDLSVSDDSVGDIQITQGDVDGALKSYLASLDVIQRVAQANPSNYDWQRSLSVTYGKVGYAQQKQNDFANALKSLRAALAIRQQLLLRQPDNPKWQQDVQNSASYLGGLAYDAILGRDFTDALAASDQAISIAPNQIWLYTNRAHALMFLGRTDEARALYLKYRGQEESDGKSWEAAVLGDFADFRKAGLTNPLMDEIAKTFKSAG